MSDADLNVIKSSIKLLENKVCRDFNEIKNLQSSNSTVGFINRTVSRIEKDLFDFFQEKMPHYSITIKNGKSNMVENSKYSIYINSISGIKNFLNGVPYFCTIIMLLEDNKPVIGLVNNYVENEMFYVSKGKGAFLNNQKIRVSNKSNIDDCLIAVKYDLSRDIFKNLVKKLPTFKVNNCSILDSCYTACGKYDSNIILDGDKNELELCKLFVEESGGLYHKLDCKSQNHSSYIFSNGLIIDKVKSFF